MNTNQQYKRADRGFAQRALDEFVSMVLLLPILATSVTIFERVLDLRLTPHALTTATVLVSLLFWITRTLKQSKRTRSVHFVDYLLPTSIVLAALRNVSRYSNTDLFRTLTKFGMSENINLLRFLANPQLVNRSGLRPTSQSVGSLFLGSGVSRPLTVIDATSSLFQLQVVVIVLVVLAMVTLTSRLLSGQKYIVRVIPIGISATIGIVTSMAAMKSGPFEVLLSLFIIMVLVNEIVAASLNNEFGFTRIVPMTVAALATVFLSSGIWTISLALIVALGVIEIPRNFRLKVALTMWENKRLRKVFVAALGVGLIALVSIFHTDIQFWYGVPNFPQSADLVYLSVVFLTPLAVNLLIRHVVKVRDNSLQIAIVVPAAVTILLLALVVTSYFVAPYEPQKYLRSVLLIGSSVVAVLSIGFSIGEFVNKTNKYVINICRSALAGIFLCVSISYGIYQIDSPNEETVQSWHDTLFHLLKQQNETNVVCLNTAIADQNLSDEAIACSEVSYALSSHQIPDLVRWMSIQKCEVLVANRPKTLTNDELRNLTVIVLDETSIHSRTGCSTPDWALPEDLIPAGKWNFVTFIDIYGKVLKHNQNLLITN